MYKHKIIPLISPPSSALAMNYFIVRNDDDLFVFRKEQKIKEKGKLFRQIKSFPKKKSFYFLLLACCFEGNVCLSCCCGKHNSQRLNSHYVI